MKLRWQRLSLWLIGILGFGSCDKINYTINRPAPMYGVPSADYIYEVTVTDEAGTPIPGIQVTALDHGHATGKVITTDENGVASDIITVFPEQFSLSLKDVDGEQNGGSFVADTVSFEEFNFQQSEKADGAWYDGAFIGKVTKALRRSE